MDKIGIFGGTFDPVHYGHLILAEQAMEDASLKQIIFMPARVQPFKMNTSIADGAHRLAMLNLAIENNPKFSLSDLELNSTKVSYTIHTLNQLMETEMADAELFFIIGTDAFLGIEKWYCSDELLSRFSFVIGSRPGYKELELEQQMNAFRVKYATDMILINNAEVEISSTTIKKRIREGKSIKYLLPEKVETYIYENLLYSYKT